MTLLYEVLKQKEVLLERKQFVKEELEKAKKENNLKDIYIRTGQLIELEWAYGQLFKLPNEYKGEDMDDR